MSAYEKEIKIYAIKHEELDDEVLVLAEDIDEAVSKFKGYCQDNYYYLHSSDDIESVSIKYKFNVIC